ncbi:MAG: hypothetical protein ABJA57_05995 [Ginsengibacter sp.]
MNEEEAEFWEKRIDPSNPGYVNESKYAGALASRFLLTGDIHFLQMSDSILRNVDQVYNHKESGPVATLAMHAITQHRFHEADSLLTAAKMIGLKTYESLMYSFDIDFESGRYDQASLELSKIRSTNDYSYYFRKSKLAHYRGDVDSSIAAMLRASKLAGTNVSLKQIALANTADLYMHDGKIKKAYDFYVQCIQLNSADFHSIMGLGWIALVHDHDDSAATRIFEFVKSKTKLPDPLFRIVQTAESGGDHTSAKKYAAEFIQQATDSVYGNMYNKYLIELYTSILNEPLKAEIVALKELDNRATPQTYAWHVWTLYINNRIEDAYQDFEKYVSGKPLEGLELYYMGKMMQGLHKGYNAHEFFKAAYKSKYDLSPVKVKEIEKYLEE